MSVDAVAVLSIPAAELRKRFAPIEKVEAGIEQGTSAGGEPFVFQPIRGGVLVHTAVSYEWSDADLVERLRVLLGDQLSRHSEKRGILVFPDAGEPEGRSYSVIVRELGANGRWLKRAGPGAKRSKGFPLSEHLSAEQLAFVRSAVFSGDPAKVAEAEAVMRGAIEAAGGEGRFEEILAEWLKQHGH